MSASNPAETSNIFDTEAHSHAAGDEEMQRAPLGIFRSRQASDTSHKNESKRRSYHSYGSGSPLNSPVATNLGSVRSAGSTTTSTTSNPTFPGTSTPTSIEDTSQRVGRSDYIVDQAEEEQEKDEQVQEQQAAYQAYKDSPTHSHSHSHSQISQDRPLKGDGEGKGEQDRESQQRSPPTTARAAGRATAIAGSTYNNSSSYQSSTVKTSKPEQKRKKRFWNNWGDNFGLGLSSSSASNTSNSANNNGGLPQFANPATHNPQSSPAPHPKLLTKKRPNTQRNQSSTNTTTTTTASPIPPHARLENVRPAAPDFAAKTSQRHSVIGLPFQSELREGSASSRDDLSHSRISRELTFNTASSQAQGEAGSQRPPAWERLGRVPHQRTASSDESYAIQSAGTSAQKSRLEPNYSEQHYSTSRPPSRQSIDPPSPSETSYTLSHQRTASSKDSSSAKGFMGSQNNQQQSVGRNAEGQSNQNNREGQYGSTLSVNNQQPGSYRNTPQASPMVQGDSNSGQGRSSTPPPGNSGNKSREDLAALDVQQLLSRHEELNDKYRKVKKYYFDKDAQVQQLQNTLAHQRLSQSRTSLDDNEYATRFSRLDGAINNLAFNIRKDWKAVPLWLAPCVNKDATTAVTKEMTAVGRACVSRWLVDEVFDRYFHPGLEPHLSSQLKVIERNLRRFAPPTNTEEEREALLAKISNWRLSTLDGLQDMLASNESSEYRTALTKLLVDMLTQDLKDNLKEPPPSGLDAGVVGIIELAVGVATNLPFESRDVYVDYIMPNTVVNEAYMRVEGVLPQLKDPGDGPPDDRQSVESFEDQNDDEQKDQGGKQKKGGVLSSLMGGSRKAGSRGNDSQSSVQKDENKVRFAAFMSVEVKGKNMLIKAPVYV